MGAVGSTGGGRLERSRERFERREALEEEREGRGEGSIAADVDVLVMVLEWCCEEAAITGGSGGGWWLVELGTRGNLGE